MRTDRTCPHYLMFHAPTKDLKLITGRESLTTMQAAGWCVLDMW